MAAPSTLVRLLAVAVVTLVALTAAPAPVAVSAPTAGETKYQNKVFRIVNNVRANHDRVKLNKNQCLQRFANRQAERMAKQRRLFHQNEDRVIDRCGLSHYAENVAFGPFPARQMVNMWMKSKDHRFNILWRPLRITGVAVRKAGGYWWAAQVFGRKN